jgi:hypothetical protein
MTKDNKDTHTQDWIIPFGGSKFDYRQYKTVKPDSKPQTILEELGIGPFGKVEKKESV